MTDLLQTTAALSCRELVGLILAYLDLELSADARAAFERHLERCAPCGGYLQQYRLAVALSRRAFDDDNLPLPAPGELERAILGRRPRRRAERAKTL
jgi:anti-sigma factor RsiW